MAEDALVDEIASIMTRQGDTDPFELRDGRVVSQAAVRVAPLLSLLPLQKVQRAYAEAAHETACCIDTIWRRTVPVCADDAAGEDSLALVDPVLQAVRHSSSPTYCMT